MSGARHDPSAAEEPKGLRAPGLRVPGKATGTFHRHGKATYWNVGDRSKALVIDFHDESLDRAVVAVDDPAGLAATINAALARSS